MVALSYGKKMRASKLYLSQIMVKATMLFTYIAFEMTPAGVFAESYESPISETTSNDEAILHMASKMYDDWHEFMVELGNHGIIFAFDYTGEALYSFRLQPSDVTRYRGLTNLRLMIDTEKLGLWPGGEFFINGQWGYGRNINVVADDVILPVSTLDARDFAQVSEYGIKQRLWGNAVRFIVGKQDVNYIFCVNDYAGYLVNPSYALISTVPMPTFPAPALGATVIAEPLKRLSLGLGFYDGSPRIGRSGFESFFDGKGGYFWILESAWKPAFGADHRLPGDYRLGFWYHSGPFAKTGTGDDAETLDGNYGFYLQMSQAIYKKKKADDGRREVGVFMQFGWAPSDRNAVTKYVGGGLQYQGMLPARTNDIFGLGASHTWLTDADREIRLTSVELFYVFQLTSWLGLQPDVQYFYNTGNHQRNGLAADVRWLVSF